MRKGHQPIMMPLDPTIFTIHFSILWGCNQVFFEKFLKIIFLIRQILVRVSEYVYGLPFL